MLDFSMTPSPTINAAAFDIFGLNIKSFREPLKRSVKDVMAKSLQKRFSDNDWEPLSDDRVRQKTALGQSSDPLRATGKLERVVGQLNVWTIGAESAQITDLPGAGYGFVHDEGYAPKNIPQRQFLVMTDDDADGIEDKFAEWITERAVAAGVFGSVF